MNIMIREGKVEDLKEMNSLFEDLDKHHRVNLPNIFKKGNIEGRTLEYIENMCKDKNSKIFVAESEGKLLGLAEVIKKKNVPYPLKIDREWIVLDTIIVKEEYRGIGIGNMLFDTILDWTKEKGINRIEVNVYEFNKSAISFYKGLGFENFSRIMYLEI